MSATSSSVSKITTARSPWRFKSNGDDVQMQCSYMLDEVTGIGGVAVNVLGVALLAHAADHTIAPAPGFFIGQF